MADTNSAPLAGRREWIGLAVLALPTLLLAVDMSVLFLALPHLAEDLAPSSSQMLWIMDIYGFMIAGFLITMGTLGDRIGRRRLLLIGAAAFGIASILAAYAQSAETLIAARTILGVAGATLMPSTLALITNMFRDPKQRGMAIAVWMACFVGGTVIAPLIGGAMLQWFWWGSVFLLGVPVMVLLLVAGPVLLPEYRDTSAGRLDLASVALSLAAILPIIFGIKELAKDGFGMKPVAALAIGAIFAVIFARRQNRLASPLLDLKLFRSRIFSSALGIMLFGAIAMGGMFLFISQYLQMVAGLSPLRAGLWLVPPTLAMIVGTIMAPVIAPKIGAGVAIGGGMFVTAIGFFLLTQVEATGGVGLVVLALGFCTFGLGPQAALVTDIVVGSAPPERAGSAASMSETSGELGIAIGVAVLGSIGTAVYRSEVTVPPGVPAEAAAASRDTLAGAVVAAQNLPAEMAAALLRPAREAFTAGLNMVAVVGVVAVLGFAFLSVTLLRRAQAAAPTEVGAGHKG